MLRTDACWGYVPTHQPNISTRRWALLLVEDCKRRFLRFVSALVSRDWSCDLVWELGVRDQPVPSGRLMYGRFLLLFLVSDEFRHCANYPIRLIRGISWFGLEAPSMKVQSTSCLKPGNVVPKVLRRFARHHHWDWLFGNSRDCARRRGWMRLLLGRSAPLFCCGTRWHTLVLVLFYESIERPYARLHFETDFSILSIDVVFVRLRLVDGRRPPSVCPLWFCEVKNLTRWKNQFQSWATICILRSGCLWHIHQLCGGFVVCFFEQVCRVRTIEQVSGWVFSQPGLRWDVPHFWGPD